MRKLLQATLCVAILSFTANAQAANDIIPTGPLLPTGPIAVGITSGLFLAKPLNGRRSYMVVANPTTNTCKVYINFGAPAVKGPGSLELVPGMSFTFETNFQPNTDIFAIADTACNATGKQY